MCLRRDDTRGYYRASAVILNSITHKQITTSNLCSYNVPFFHEDIVNSAVLESFAYTRHPVFILKNKDYSRINRSYDNLKDKNNLFLQYLI